MSDLESLLKQQGFDSVNDFNYLTGMLIHEEGVEKFYSWRNEDGTKSGLLKLLNISPRVEMVSIPNTEYEALVHERDSLRAALESLTSAWFAGVSGSPDRTEVSRYCVYCSGYMSFTSAVNTNETPFAHKPDCPIVRARKLLEMSNE